jgi:hypothetical protein
MNAQPTPRTDANVKRHNLCRLSGNDLVYADFPRQLERELATVTAQRDGMEEKLRIELRGYPDSELWGDAGLIAATMRCVDALDVVTAQRDRLAEAVENIIRIYENPAKGCIPSSSDMYDEALQSLTTNAKP